MKSSFYLNLAKKTLLIKLHKKMGVPFQLPYKYTFDLTYDCNSRCKTCSIWSNYQKENKKEIKLYEFKKTIKNIKNDILWLTFSGGEPTLKEDLPLFVEAVSKNCKNLAFINIPTNGLNSQKIRNTIKKSLDLCNPKIDFLVTISIDGLENTHDHIRGIKGAYKKALTTLKQLEKLKTKYKNFDVSIQTVISKYNLDQIKKIYGKFKEKDIYFTLVHKSNYFKNLNHSNLIENDKKNIEIIKFLYKNKKIKQPGDIIQKIFLKLYIKYLKNQNKQVIPCYSSYSSLTIDAFCNIKPCDSYNKTIGNLRNNNYNIKRILKNKTSKKIRKEIKYNKCPICWVDCEAYSSIIENPLKSIKEYILK